MSTSAARTGLFALLAALPCTARGLGQDGAPAASVDPRTAYDVATYRIDLRVDPGERRIAGAAAVEVRVAGESLSTLVLDMHRDLEALEVLALEPPLDGTRPLEGAALAFRRAGDQIECELAAPAHGGGSVALAVRYAGSPEAHNSFDGFHWRETADGRPWISTSFQTLGAHHWWPCKASFFHPEDKQERLFVNLTVPAGLTAVSNGRLVARSSAGEGWETFHWEHDYPCPTYAVTLNVAPFVAIEGQLELAGVAEPVPYAYYVLPENEAKARLQFAEVPGLLAIYGQAFGPWPFPAAKVGLVETSFWGMEHSTAVAYGSSYPAWLALHGESDPHAARNRRFDYILVHELAHEWWGNAVSAADWGDLWLHEGFATYAEGVYVEERYGRAEADRFFAEQAGYVHPKATLYRGRGTSAKEAFSGAVYCKGACVLNTLRHYLADDELWWRVLREFQARYRYRNAESEDLRAVLEELSQRDWQAFFAEWVHGAGYPRLTGRVGVGEGALVLEISNPSEPTPFHVPLDLAWFEGSERRERRIWLEPGENRLVIPTAARPADVEVLHLERLLGKHALRVE